MSWQVGTFVVIALVILVGVVWYERSRPSARIVAAVAALAALGVAGRVALAPLPNVVATTDIALLSGYALGGGPGFAVGALSALVSNFWLGQGPWTPWQMAGWGMVGVGGAALAALTGRRLGRWGLAAVAAMAGLLYGALLDLSAMVNFGGEQSVDRYLALSARAIPFNIAHALGNAALMLAAGPALVRMLDRFRQRSEVEWAELGPADSELPPGGRSRPLPAGLALALVALTLAGGTMLATAPPAEAADRGVAWLERAQNRDGGWGTAPGGGSSPGMTGWAMLGLEAAGVNPLDVRSGGNSAVGYLRANVSQLTTTGDLERTILALDAAGVSPRDFGGRDLVSELRGRRSRDGSFDRQVNLTAFGILALRAVGERAELGRSAAWLRGAQGRDGGWGSTAGGRGEPDSTGAALQALAVAPGGDSQLARGVEWLRRAQRGDGGWALTEGGSSNTQSTAWAVQGLIAAGVDPASVRRKGRSPFDYLASTRRGDGHFSYSSGSDQTPVWVTAQALTAIEREPFPLPRAVRQPSAGGQGGGDSGQAGGGSGSGGVAASGGSRESAGTSAVGARSQQRPKGDERGGRSKAGQKTRDGRSDRRSVKGAAAGPADEPASEPSGDLAATAATPVSAVPADGFEAPSTAVMLAGLALVGAGLAGGWLVYRRRLP